MHHAHGQLQPSCCQRQQTPPHNSGSDPFIHMDHQHSKLDSFQSSDSKHGVAEMKKGCNSAVPASQQRGNRNAQCSNENMRALPAPVDMSQAMPAVFPREKNDVRIR